MLEDLKRRGLIRQTTFDRLAGPLTFYIGFDPTAESLHVGHLIAILTAKRLVALGNRAIILIGDSTASIDSFVVKGKKHVKRLKVEP